MSGILLVHADGRDVMLTRTTVRDLGRDESFLEERVACQPEMLGLFTLDSGIQGPCKCFRGISLRTPTGRLIRPDVVIVTQSAHVIVVEVKLRDNPELINRSVIAQVIDYAASLSLLDQTQFAEALEKRADSGGLAALAAQWFPDLDDADEFAEVVADRCQRGDIEVVVVCDEAPVGLGDLGHALNRLSALAFRLRVVELAAFVSPQQPGQIVFMRHERLRTEVVARTHVEVTWNDGEVRPTVAVATTSLDEIDDALRETRGEATATTLWHPNMIREHIAQSDATPAVREVFTTLLEHAIEHTGAKQVLTQRAAGPSFAYRLTRGSKKGAGRTLWTASPASHVYLNLETVRGVGGEALVEQVREDVQRLLGVSLEGGTTWGSLRGTSLVGHVGAFLDLLEALRRTLEDAPA